MTLLLTTLIIVTCILLIIIVLVQNPKGGGLSSSFGGGGTQLFGGVKKTTDFLDRGTWALAIVLVVLVMISNIALSPGNVSVEQRESALDDVQVDQAQAPAEFSMPDGNPSAMPQSVDTAD
ncbi:preprotein translocase subunit SecG [Croceimicrobium sp.]|uniref:preprotein translocase subunit SecG n=1 Tax=Croceimicrobium sp. TaxID=2828340 RepID=UPI003BAC758F